MFKGHKKVYVNKNRTNYNFDSINSKLLLKNFYFFFFSFLFLQKNEFNDLHKIYALNIYAYKKNEF